MRLLTLLTDAYGGKGGIAQHNRNLLEALCTAPGGNEVVALPRLLLESPGSLPERLTYDTAATQGKLAYMNRLFRWLWESRQRPFDGVICGHIHLLPAAVLAARGLGVPLVLIVHGIEAWAPMGALYRWLLRAVDVLVAVSDVTRRRLLAWAPMPRARTVVIPNGVALEHYGALAPRADLVARYGLEGHRVLITVGRLSASERYKGHDEVLDLLPSLLVEMPDLIYLIVGDGDDRPRLEARTHALGVAHHIVFAGYVPEAEKPDHYRLADAFVMPGCGEGFGIAYLEAMACGVPVVASTADASREAVLDGALGEVADPANPASIRAAIRRAMARPRGVPEALGMFSVAAFQARWHALLHTLPTRPAPGS